MVWRGMAWRLGCESACRCSSDILQHCGVLPNIDTKSDVYIGNGETLSLSNIYTTHSISKGRLRVLLQNTFITEAQKWVFLYQVELIQSSET